MIQKKQDNFWEKMAKWSKTSMKQKDFVAKK